MADSKKRNAAFAALRNQVLSANTEKDAEYRALQTDAERRQFLIDYILDPESCCKRIGTNSTSRSTNRRETSKVEWLTEEQLAGPKYLNSAAHAKIAIKSMRERPHKTNAGLRAAGVKEYEYFKEKSKVDKDDERNRHLLCVLLIGEIKTWNWVLRHAC